MSKTLLSFSLTPVQKFIEAARTVRDLKAGSRILSHLTKCAIQAGQDQGGELLFPQINSQPDSIPNQFVMKFGDPEKANDADTKMRTAVNERWSRIASSVHDALNAEFEEAFQETKSKCDVKWDADWDEQIDLYWDVRVIVLAEDEVPDVLKPFGAPEPDTVDIAAHVKALQLLLGAHKEVRHFPGDHGIGRHKCSMLGELEQMGPTGLTEPREFWEQVAGTTSGGAILGAKDRLCAISLVKRFCAVDAALNDLSEGVPDTAEIATDKWWARAEGVALGLCEDFTTARNRLRDALGNTGDTERRYLLMDELNAQKIAEDAGARVCDITCEVKGLAGARKALFSATDEAGMETPPRYYAILALDGDHVGQWLSGEKCDVDNGFYERMSKALQEYAETVKGIVETHNGHLVYAGGDDILALLPLATAMACAAELRRKFPEFAEDHDGHHPTASAGISILHYMYDLRSGLREAREAEQRAKQRGRDRVGINLLKRSGSDIGLTLRWCMLDKLTELQKRFMGDVSDRWLYKLNDTLPALRESCHLEAIEPLISQALKRAEMPEEKRLQLRDEFLLPLWRDVKTELDSQHEEMKNSGHDPDECPDKNDSFPELALKSFVKFGLTASFLARGRD